MLLSKAITRAVPLALGVLIACGPDETVSGYVDPSATYVLTALSSPTAPEDAPLPQATIQFPKEGEVAGEGPCNRYWGQQTVPYPWIELRAIATTRRACPDLAAEAAYIRTLSHMTFAEVTGDVLLLSNEQDEVLTFVRQSD